MTDLGNGLLAVSVPEDAEKLLLDSYGTIFYRIGKKLKTINTRKQDLKILGTVTASEIDFDVHPYCEHSIENPRKYKLYPSGETNFNTVSFRSLLSSKGLFFENPYGREKPKKVSVYDNVINGKSFDSEVEKWQQAENNLVQKLIILKRL
jgi:hypothetical protein